MMAFVLDAIDPYSLKRALERINKLRDPTAARGDLDFLRHLRRARSPVPPPIAQRPWTAASSDPFAIALPR